MPLLKYYTSGLKYSIPLYTSFLSLDFEDTGRRRVFELYDNATRRISGGRTGKTAKNAITKLSKDNVSSYYKSIKYGSDADTLYNEIACKWMRQSEDIYKNWFDVSNDMEVIYIGGIFPITAAGAAYAG